MNERLSRAIGGIEAVVILLPLTLVMIVFLGPFSGMIAIGRQYPARDSILLLILVVLLSALVCGWKLMYTFLRHGSAGLYRQAASWWIAPCLAIAVILVAALISKLWDVKPDQAMGAFLLFGNGIIATVPFIHLALERLLRANKAMKATR